MERTIEFALSAELLTFSREPCANVGFIERLADGGTRLVEDVVGACT
jgi:hypothetical protein